MCHDAVCTLAESCIGHLVRRRFSKLVVITWLLVQSCRNPLVLRASTSALSGFPCPCFNAPLHFASARQGNDCLKEIEEAPSGLRRTWFRALTTSLCILYSTSMARREILGIVRKSSWYSIQCRIFVWGDPTYLSLPCSPG